MEGEGTNITIDTKISRKFTRLYIIALSAVAVLSVIGQVLVQIALKEQSSDSRVVNIAGRQRMLSQNICKNVLLLGYNIDTLHRIVQRKELEESLVAWHKFHRGLQSGNLDTLRNRINNSDTILQLFAQIEPDFLNVYNHALALSSTFAVSNTTYCSQAIGEILQSEKRFLSGMDKIVYMYAQEARQRVDTLKRIEILLLLVTLTILVLEGVFIFRPAVAQLHKTMVWLIESETRAQHINKELLMANQSLQQTEQELLNSTNEKYQRQIHEQKIRSSSLIQGQESERKRIARDIHDGVGQMLTALKLNLESIAQEQLPEKERGRLEEARKLIAKTIVETRTITFNLMPTVLSDFGIMSGLKQLADQASKNSGAHVTFLCPVSFDRLDKHIEIGIYRISQEAINNALKYAQATDISVELLLKDQYLYLTVIDNGSGFDMDIPDLGSAHRKISNGINNMQERTNLLDGEFKILSTPGKGTTIWAKIPVKYQ